MTIIPDRLSVLDDLVLRKGAHTGSVHPSDGACVMEAVAFLAGEPWSDTPACASPVIGAFLRSLNDSWDDERRQTLTQYVPRLVGSAASTEVEERRAWMATDWLVRVHTPAFLRLAGLTEHADRLADMVELSPGTVPSIRPAIDAARKDAAAAWAAAWAAAGDAAGAAAADAAGAAAAAAAAAAARAAALDAAGDILTPTVDSLQDSIHDLIDRMLSLTEGDAA